MLRSSGYAVLGSLAVVVFSCATAPKQNDTIAEARAKIQHVEQMPMAGEVASQEIAHAHTALMEAENLAKKNKKSSDIANAAYIAKRHAEIAEQQITVAQAKKSVESAERERQAVLIASREEEARRNAQAATSATQAANSATRDAEAATKEADEAKRKLELLQQELSELNAKQTERGLVLTLGDVLFDTGKAILKPGALPSMDRLAKFMKDSPQQTLVIEGHTDSVGSDAYNQTLSEQRANSVREALATRGVDSKQINAVVGKGEGSPVASNDDAGGRQQNRRVEIILDNGKTGERVSVDK